MFGLILLLSMCIGLINAARGSGIHNMKFPLLIAMSLSAYTITHNIYYALLFPVPQAIIFATGTGQYMPFVTKYINWRIFEWLYIFLYSLILGLIWTSLT